MLKKIILWSVIIIVIGLIVAYFTRNYLVARAIESASSHALGVETELGSASLGIGAGKLELSDFEARNPEGFDSTNIVRMQSVVLDVDEGSIFDDQFVVDSLVLDGIYVDLEQKNQRGNWNIVMDNIKKYTAGETSSEGQRIRIKKVDIRNIAVNAMLELVGKKYQESFSVDNITLTNVGGESGSTIGQITAQVFRAILTRSVTSGKGHLPGDFGDVLSGAKEEAKSKIESEVKNKLEELGGSITGDKK